MNRAQFYLFLMGVIFLPAAIASTPYLFDVKNLDYSSSGFLSTQNDRISMLVPVLLVTVCFIAAAIDFGAMAVIFASIGSLVICYWIKLLQFNIYGAVMLLILAGIAVFKMRQ